MNKSSLAYVTIILILLGSIAPVIPVDEKVEYTEKEPYTEQEPYQEEVTVTEQVPIQYDIQDEYKTSVGVLDWEIKYVAVLENVDNTGGPFSVSVDFYDGSSVAETDSERAYIGPGETHTFEITSSGLKYSTDWGTRYDVAPTIDEPEKTVERTKTVTKHRTITKYREVTKYRTETKHKSAIELLLN